MAGGDIFTSIFFFSLFIAAISSLIAMLELGVRLLMDYGMLRKIAVTILCLIAVLIGFPSAYSLRFFNNQDWVWGVGLLLSGFFFIFFILKFGIKEFRDKILEYRGRSLLMTGNFLNFLFSLMVFEFLIMFAWWFIQSMSWYPEKWWDPFEEFTIGTCMFQWIILIGIGMLFNNKLSSFSEIEPV